MRFAEVLLPSGEVDQSNLRGARQVDVFILRGDTTNESFEPHFTYHGFRYVQISGLRTVPTEDTVQGVVIQSDLQMTGELRVNSPLIQQVWRNTVWTQRSNFIGIPTDCPQRDERLGYLADAGVFWDAAAFNMDVDAFTRRHMQNAADSQSPEGAYPTYAPIPFASPWIPSPSASAIPGWADGGILLPWTAWRRYKDVAVIEQNWEGMRHYIQFILDRNPDYVWRNGRADIGDWLAADQRTVDDATTPHELIGTAYWAHSVKLLAQMAAAIARRSDAAALLALHERIRRAFADEFVKTDGRVGNESQTSYVLALKFDLVAKHVRPSAAARLAADIRRRGGALSTGYLGTQHVLDVLADTGYAVLAYDLLLRTEYPSFGYMIVNNATTIWESWNGRVWAGLGDETMPSSNNHYALGSVCGFLFRRVAGIDAVTPGFETILVRPVLDSRVRRGGGDYESVLGRISVDWTQVADGGFSLKVTIPPNANGLIHLPTRSGSRIREGAEGISHRTDMHVADRVGDEAVIAVGSGTYLFTVGD